MDILDHYMEDARQAANEVDPRNIFVMANPGIVISNSNQNDNSNYASNHDNYTPDHDNNMARQNDLPSSSVMVLDGANIPSNSNERNNDTASPPFFKPSTILPWYTNLTPERDQSASPISITTNVNPNSSPDFFDATQPFPDEPHIDQPTTYATVLNTPTRFH